MGKENRGLLINTVVIVLITAILAIVYITLIPKTTEDKIFNRVVKLEEVDYDKNYDVNNSILSKSVAKMGKSEIGVVYRVDIKNDYFLDIPSDSLIELFIGIDKNDKVSVEIGTLNQSSWAIKGINAFVDDVYKKLPKDEVYKVETYSVADTTTGPTAQDSVTAIKEAVIYIVDYHYGELTVDPYIPIFGEEYTLEEDTTFVGNERVTEKRNVLVNSDVVGYVYTTNATGISNDGKEFGEETTGEIILNVVLDKDLNVQLLDFDEENYGHSSGSYIKNMKNYYNDKLIGNSIIDYTPYDKDVDGSTGSTNTIKTLDTIMVSLGGLLNE